MAHARTHAAASRARPPTTSTSSRRRAPSYEHTDANVWIIVKFALWLVISAVVIHVGLWLTFALFVEQRDAHDRGASFRWPSRRRRAAAAAGAAPAAVPGERDLSSSGGRRTPCSTATAGSNKDAGTVRIPIDEAMRLTRRARPAVAAADGAPATRRG